MRLLSITFAVFVGFLTIGLSLPVLPLHVHGTLGMDDLMVGIVAGCQPVAALLSRMAAGKMADTRDAKRAMATGFLIAVTSGIAYFASGLITHSPYASVGVLLVGRLLLGCAESFIVTGALSWGIGIVGPQRAGKAMAWVGIAMYGAYAAGAPVGVLVYANYGFAGIAVATALIPLLALFIVGFVRATKPSGMPRVPFYKVLGAVWGAGLGLFFSSIGFSTITAFAALLFSVRGWGSASLVFSAFGVAFIAARVLFGSLPDRVGGAKVALVCVVIEAAGQFLMWRADAPTLAYVGAMLTGFGYSLAFPGFGVEAVRRVAPQSRGVAMGAYVAFLDIALGIAGPGAGIVSKHFGVNAIYLVGSVAVALAVLVAVKLLASPPRTA